MEGERRRGPIPVTAIVGADVSGNPLVKAAQNRGKISSLGFSSNNNNDTLPPLSSRQRQEEFFTQTSIVNIKQEDFDGDAINCNTMPAHAQFYSDNPAIKMEPLDDLSHLTNGTAASYGSVRPGILGANLVSMNKRETQLDKATSSRFQSKNKCKVCGRGFSLRILLKRHLKSHNRLLRSRKSESIPHPSSSKTKNPKDIKRRRIASKLANGKMKCSIALRRMFRNGCVKNQSKTKHVGMMSSNSLCFVCQKWFSYKAVFKLHMAKTHTSADTTNTTSKDNSFNIYTSNNSSFVSHILPTTEMNGAVSVSAVVNRNQPVSRATKEKKYKCPLCDKSFTQSGKLSSHKKKHTGEKPFHCSVCGKDFALKDHLNIHIKIHTDERPYACMLCDKSFRQGGHLRMHMQTHTGVKPHKCELCDKAFSQKGSLMSHMRMHTGGKLQYQCTMCEKSFRDSTKLNNHIRTHTGEKPFQCSLCDKAFSQSGDLVRHMRTHTGEKPYVCTVCNKQFSEGSNLNKHMRTHTGYRPHECSICHKAFSEGSTLKNHMRIHSGEKPYQCSVCQKEFIQSGDLYKHMRTHTGEKPHSCDLCGRAFTESSTLKKHMKTHQKDGNNSSSSSGGRRSRKFSLKPRNIQFDEMDRQNTKFGDLNGQRDEFVNNIRVSSNIQSDSLGSVDCGTIHVDQSAYKTDKDGFVFDPFQPMNNADG